MLSSQGRFDNSVEDKEGWGIKWEIYKNRGVDVYEKYV
jgi:hypothetical protein